MTLTLRGPKVRSFHMLAIHQIQLKYFIPLGTNKGEAVVQYILHIRKKTIGHN
jgi:hypothetical protein